MTEAGIIPRGTFAEDTIESIPKGKESRAYDENDQPNTTSLYEKWRQTEAPFAHEERTEMSEERDSEGPFVESISQPTPLKLGPEEIIEKKLPIISSFMPKLDSQAQFILRVHYISQILSDVLHIQNYCGQPQAAVFAESLLSEMRTMDEISPSDPFLEILMALHDALAFQNNWSKYTKDQYEGAYILLKKFAKRPNLRNDAVEKAIIELEVLGFDTTPFEMDTNSINENNNKK